MRCRSKKKFQRELNKLDQQNNDIMMNLEQKCKCIKSGHIPFSPESVLWIQHAQVFRSLLRYHHGLIRNIGNLKRMARRCGILRCLSVLEDEAVFASESVRKDAITLGNMGISPEKNIYKNAYRMQKSWMTKKEKGRF
jgi:hypothetical protein